MLELSMLPARQGDALWIRWGPAHAPYQMLVDMGTMQTGRAIRRRLEALPESQREFELLVVTHVDSDHIGGIISGLVDPPPLPGLEFRDIWFNGYDHLHGRQIQPAPDLLAMGPVQGEEFSRWLKDQPWNRAFDGWPVRRVAGEPPRRVVLADGLALTVLGPTPERLSDLIGKWTTEVAKALRSGALEPLAEADGASEPVSPGLVALGRPPPAKPDLPDRDALEALAIRHRGADDSEANGSSILLLLEYEGVSILLSGDAFAADIVAGIRALRPDGPLELDAFKLPHHGSRKNVLPDLIQTVNCGHWLVSTDGTQHYHPDAEAIARILLHSAAQEPTLFFNVPGTYNAWWSQPEWRERFGYRADYGTSEEGLTIMFG